MKGTWKGFDPEIEKEYAQGSMGSVIGRVKSSPAASMPDGLSAQEQQDWILAQRNRQSSSAPESEMLDGQRKLLGRAVQNVQMEARALGKSLGAVSARQILEMADRGELKELKSIEPLRQLAQKLGE